MMQVEILEMIRFKVGKVWPTHPHMFWELKF